MDQIGSNQADVCVVLTVTAPGGSDQFLNVQECGCSGQCLPTEAVPGRGASELLQVNTGKMFCTALQGMKLLISTLLLPVPPCLSGTLICSNRSGLCYLTWLTSHCKYDHSLPLLSRSVWGVLVTFSIPGCCCKGLSWHPGRRDRFLSQTAYVWMNHHAVLLNHLSRQRKALLLLLGSCAWEWWWDWEREECSNSTVKLLWYGWGVPRNTWIADYCWFVKIPVFFLGGSLE